MSADTDASEAQRRATTADPSCRDDARAHDTSRDLRLREARDSDLAAINAVIEAAVMTWQLADRVKRLSLPIYRYSLEDLRHMQAVVAEGDGGELLGVATWEPATARDAPDGARALLLHGIYVAPGSHRRGIGARLLAEAERAMCAGGYDGLLVKANPDAVPFFEARGLTRLPVGDSARDYPYRFWKPRAE